MYTFAVLLAFLCKVWGGGLAGYSNRRLGFVCHFRSLFATIESWWEQIVTFCPHNQYKRMSKCNFFLWYFDQKIIAGMFGYLITCAFHMSNFRPIQAVDNLLLLLLYYRQNFIAFAWYSTWRKFNFSNKSLTFKCKWPVYSTIKDKSYMRIKKK